MKNIKDEVNTQVHLEVRCTLSGKTTVDVSPGSTKVFLSINKFINSL